MEQINKKKITEWKLAEIRNTGRSRKRWMEDIAKDLQSMGITN